MKTRKICLSILLSLLYFTASSQQQFDQLIIGNKSTIPPFASTWIEGNDNPGIFFNRPGQNTDEKLWAQMVVADEFRIMSEKDNFSAIKTAFLIKRGSGINIDYVSFPEGSVGIGTTSMGSHKLAVEGTIGARGIKVEATGWSDFVFDNNYKLRTLEAVEKYIDEKGHLPEIPSEAEVIENGIDLSTMDAKLLQKIEELTLYLIEQNKRMNELEAKNTKLEEEVSALKNK